MEKSRKKQRSMAIVVIVLMACLILALGTFTFAKYISSGSTNQSATAAQWGFVLSLDSSDLLGKDYTLADGGLATRVDSNGVAVSATNLVVAPGTSGTLKITVSGSAETLAKLSITANFEKEIKRPDGNTPITWSLSSDDKDYASGQFSNIIKSLDEHANCTYDAGQTVNQVYYLRWSWPFDFYAGNNGLDTIIGYKAAGKTYEEIKNLVVGTENRTVGFICSYNADNYNNVCSTEMSFTINVAIEQIQTPPGTSSVS